MRQIALLLVLSLTMLSHAITGAYDLLYREAAMREDEEFYYQVFVPADCKILQCPPLDYAWLTDDPDQQLVMEALYDWYLNFHYGKARMLQNQTLVLITNPYILLDSVYGEEKMIYCCATLTLYGMYEEGDGQRILMQWDTETRTFVINCRLENEQWTVRSVIESPLVEDIIPSWCVGTQEVDDILDQILDDDDFSAYTDDYARIYLDMNHMKDVPIMCEGVFILPE